jgi:hypothetical protein
MKKLTEENIEYICEIINKSNISSQDMKEDLIDHFCCAVEEYMKKGAGFQASFEKAYQSISPNGLDEIQNETIYLLTFKKIKVMKRLLYVSGYLSVIGITTTLFLKINHLPFGSLSMLITFINTVFIFLPTLFSYLYKRTLSKSMPEKLKYMSGFIGSALLITAIFFKIFHWPGYLALLLISLIIINFMFFPFIFLKMYKKSAVN